MADKPIVDWEAIEREYRAGVLSFAEIGAQHGVSKGRISQVAKAKGWTRDLSAKIQAKAEAKLNAEALNGELNAERAFSEHVLIEANATAIAKVRSGHRKDIGRARSLSAAMLAELEAQTEAQADFAQLGELLTAPDEETNEAGKKRLDRLKSIFDGVISLPGRVDTLKKWAETARILFDKEREAYGIAAEVEPPKPPAEAEVPTNAMARKFAFALKLGMDAANDNTKPSKAA